MSVFNNLTIDKQIGISIKTNGDILKNEDLHQEFQEIIIFKSKTLHLQIITNKFLELRILG